MIYLNNEIHIAMYLSDKDGWYSKYTATTIVSVLENTKEEICIHFFHDGTINEKFFRDIVNRYNQKIIFYKIEIEKDFGNIITEKPQWRFSMMKFYIFEKCDVDRIIFLDSGDVLVLGDIKRFWNLNIDDYFCGVVTDLKETTDITVNNVYYKKLNINPKKYFNSGIMFFNLKYIRQKFNVILEAKQFFLNHKYFPFIEQDFFNYLLKDKIKVLDAKYHFLADNIDVITPKSLENILLVHFAGIFKPWCCTNESVIRLYSNYYGKIFDENKNEELKNFIIRIPKNFSEKMNLKNSLIYYRKKDRITSILCLLKGFLSNTSFKNGYINLIKIKNRIQYRYYYFKEKR